MKITVERISMFLHQSGRMTANSYNVTRDGVATENPRYHELKSKKGPRRITKWTREILEIRQHPSLKGKKNRVLRKLTEASEYARPSWMQNLFTKAAEARIKRALMKSPRVSVKVG